MVLYYQIKDGALLRLMLTYKTMMSFYYNLAFVYLTLLIT